VDDAFTDVARLHEEPVARVETRGDVVVVALQGELDLYNAQLVRSALDEATSDRAARVVVDLQLVTFVDSTAMGILIEGRSRLKENGSFVLAAPGLETRRALEVSGLDRHFTIRDTVDAAVADSVG
jgi:anti-sigma B factor antagonist